MDADSSGSIDENELLHGLQLLGVNLQNGQLETVVALIDSDNDGNLSYQGKEKEIGDHKRFSEIKFNLPLSSSKTFISSLLTFTTTATVPCILSSPLYRAPRRHQSAY